MNDPMRKPSFAAGVPAHFTPHNYWLACPRVYLMDGSGQICPGPGDGARCATCVGSADTYMHERRLAEKRQAIEAAGKYAVVHVGKVNHVLRESMTSLESHLPQRFLRISRSVIVNIDQIQELQPMFKGENRVMLKNGKSYPTTRPIRELQQKLEFR